MPYVLLLPVLAMIAFCDLRHLRIPLRLPAAALLITLGAAAIGGGTAAILATLGSATMAAMALATIGLATSRLIGRAALGPADVAVAAVLGAALGPVGAGRAVWHSVLLAVLILALGRLGRARSGAAVACAMGLAAAFAIGLEHLAGLALLAVALPRPGAPQPRPAPLGACMAAAAVLQILPTLWPATASATGAWLAARAAGAILSHPLLIT